VRGHSLMDGEGRFEFNADSLNVPPTAMGLKDSAQ
jgi:hypothetical protein